MSYPVPEFFPQTDSIFDTHCHYASEQYENFLDEIFSQFKTFGVKGVINCGCTIASSKKNIELANKYDCCYAAVGFHPQDITNEPLDFEALENLLKCQKVVALGEIGLDYYWNKENKESQIEAFISQIKLAKKYDLPIIVHDRDAHADTLEILKKYKPKGVVHCFSGSVEMAREIIKLGMYIGVGGVVTFKNARRLVEVVEDVSLDKILLETDGPYLSPEPFRGKLNNSFLIPYIAKKISEIKEIPLDNVYEITKANAIKLFSI